MDIKEFNKKGHLLIICGIERTEGLGIWHAVLLSRILKELNRQIDERIVPHQYSWFTYDPAQLADAKIGPQSEYLMGLAACGIIETMTMNEVVYYKIDWKRYHEIAGDE